MRQDDQSAGYYGSYLGVWGPRVLIYILDSLSLYNPDLTMSFCSTNISSTQPKPFQALSLLKTQSITGEYKICDSMASMRL